MDPEGVAEITRLQPAWACSTSVLLHCVDSPVGIEKDPMKHTESVIQSDLEIMADTRVSVAPAPPSERLTTSKAASRWRNFVTISRGQSGTGRRCVAGEGGAFARARPA